MLLVDAHCHLHEYSEEDIKRILSKQPLIIIAVSDDYLSSLRTLALARMYKQAVIPCLGIHPWSVHELADPIAEAKKIVRLCVDANVNCIGEVGLDRKFYPETFDIQLRVFKVFLEAARDYDMVLNIHAAGAWDDVLKLLLQYRIRRALIHWYTGPLSLLNEIVKHGYFISINPAVKVQKKHANIAERAPLESILTESDGPYNYRGLKLSPLLLPDTVRELSRIKGVSYSSVVEAVRNNVYRLFSLDLK